MIVVIWTSFQLSRYKYSSATITFFCQVKIKMKTHPAKVGLSIYPFNLIRFQSLFYFVLQEKGLIRHTATILRLEKYGRI